MDDDGSGAEGSATDSSVDDAPVVGTTLGRYVVIEEVGSGGMGRVMRGYDPRLHREVALKQLHPGVLPGAAQLQLLLEARTMAKLNHPNVVGIYDVFAQDDTAVLVMAYVRGQTLSQWLQTRRTPQRIVEMFLTAARGLMAAHRRGVLHRDFKPANVLVDATEAPKVTDFGLARAVAGTAGSSAAQAEDDDVTTLRDSTAEGSGLRMGTPAYMAPEQHMDGPLDERTDQYAFCIALWEALTGQLPFHSRGDEERLAQAKFDGPPPWPSAVKLDPTIVDALRRGLSPHPYDRWPSIEALCVALRAGLRHRAPRRKAMWAAAVSVVAMGGVAWAGASWSGPDACRAGDDRIARSWNEHEAATIRTELQSTGAPYAKVAWERVEPELHAYAEQWASIHAEACASSGVRKEQAAMADPRMVCLADALTSFDATLDRLREADALVAQRALDLVGRLPPLEPCRADRGLEGPSRVEGAPSPLLEHFHRELAKARTLWFVGRYDEAATVVAELREAVGGLDEPTMAVDLGLIDGQILGRQGHYLEAEAQLRRTFELALDIGHWRAALTAAQGLVKYVGYDLNRHDEGLAWGRVALGLQDRVDASGALASDTANNIGLVYLEAGDPERAELEHRKALEQRVVQLGSGHMRVADSHNNIAMALYEQGRYAEAEAEHRLALALREQALGPDHPDVGASHNNLAMTLRARDALDEAEREYLRAAEIWAESLGPEHPHLVLLQNNLGNLYRQQERDYEAERVLRGAVELAERVHGRRSVSTALALSSLAITLEDLERYDEAEAALREVLATYGEILGPGHPDVAGVHQNLGSVLFDRRDYDAAEVEFERALKIYEATLGHDHLNAAYPLCALGEVAVARGRPRDGLPFVLRCHAIRVDQDATPPLLNTAVFASVEVFVGLGQLARARALVRSTLTTLEALGPAAEVERRELRDWLERHV